MQVAELTISSDPMARQQAVEDKAGAYAGEKIYGKAANLPASRPHRPSSGEMGPGAESRPLAGVA